MRKFLESHRCNAICRHLDLPVPDGHRGATATPAYVPVHGDICAPPRGGYGMRATMLTPSHVIYENEGYDPDN